MSRVWRSAGGEEPLVQIVGEWFEQWRVPGAVALGVLVADRLLADVAPRGAAAG
ncbi:MAG: hypothetical protein ACLP8S_31700 [Solirubrobacteraceae bacterium]